MKIGLLSVSIHLPGSHSLKEKRSVIRSLRDRIGHAMNVSFAEVGKQDVWQVAEIAFVTVAADTGTVQGRLSKIQSLLSFDPRFTVNESSTEMLS